MDRRQRQVALLVAGAFFMEMLDGTILATAAPSIARSFGVDSSEIGVTITAYLVTVAVLIPLGGWLCERWGAKRVFLIAIALFTVASALCAATTSVPLLTATRVLQGAGAAMMVPVGRLAVLRSVAKTDVIRAIAYLTWPGLLAPVLAPVIGGAIATYATWHWIFLVNVPLGVLGAVLAVRLMADPPRAERTPLDVPGLLYTMVAVGGLVVAAESVAGSEGAGVVTLAVLAVAIVSMVVAVWHLRRTAHPLLDLSVLKVRTFRLTQSSGAVYRMTIVGVPFLLPLMFQDAFGWTPVRAGAFVLFLFAGNLAIKPATTPLLMRFGFKPVLSASVAAGAAAMVAIAFLTPNTPPVWIAALLVVSGIARSVGFSAYASLTFADLDQAQLPKANTLAAALSTLAEGLGVALGALALRFSAPAEGVVGAGVGPYRFAFLALAAVLVLPLVDALLMRRDAGGSLREVPRKSPR
jgi:EmrB/QacA subfamily drug resistance transporter